MVIPDELEPTLGKMCRAVRDKPEKWETDSGFDGSVQTILGMMDMVWKGHLRHGKESAPLEVSAGSRRDDGADGGAIGGLVQVGAGSG